MRTKYALCIWVLFLGRLATASVYDTTVLSKRPILYFKMMAPQGSQYEGDFATRRWRGRYYPAGGSGPKSTMPNGDTATVFDGHTQYLELPASSAFSIPASGGFTLEMWIRPDGLNFPSQESDGYVHFAGKGEPGEHEYALRMYSKVNSASRPNRISGYVFNLEGGLGSGSYFQDTVVAGQWIHVAMVVVNGPNGTVSIYKNGVLRKTTPLSQFDVTPEAGNAPLRIATRDRNSFFKGAIGKVAVYRKALSASQLLAHYQKMFQ